MPRKPTGRPRGRPAGSGQLGEEGTGHKRLTVRLPSALYDALEAVAEREHYTREAPELARTVRTALEHYLACPHRRQTGIVPSTGIINNWQIENMLEALEDNIRQTEIVPETEHIADESRSEKRQTEIVPKPLWEDKRQTEIARKLAEGTYVLGKLCKYGHEWQQTGQSILKKKNRWCIECDAESARQRRQNKRAVTGRG